MKKIAFLAAVMIALLASAPAAKSQTINYPFAAADYQAVTATNDSVQFSPVNSWTFVSSTIDTTTKVVCTAPSYVKTGWMVFVKITAPSTANQTITFTGLTSASATITKSKTVIYSFIYIYDGYKLFATQQIN